MTDNSHTAHEPHPTAAMDRQLNDLLYRPNEDTVFMSDFNEDEVIHIELAGKRKVYSEAAYNKLLAERDRLRKALRGIKSMPPSVTWVDQFHGAPSWWRSLVRQMYDIADEALQGDRDDKGRV